MMKQPSHPAQETRPRVIAGIPCFNTNRSIKDMVSRARKHVDQVIAIDDGSSDGTAEVARAAGALVISHDRNMGYGEALKSCFEAARANAADVLVILDGDGQHNPDEIPRLLAPIFRGEAGLIIGSRFLTNEHNMPWYRRFGIKVITLLRPLRKPEGKGLSLKRFLFPIPMSRQALTQRQSATGWLLP